MKINLVDTFYKRHETVPTIAFDHRTSDFSLVINQMCCLKPHKLSVHYVNTDCEGKKNSSITNDKIHKCYVIFHHNRMFRTVNENTDALADCCLKTDVWTYIEYSQAAIFSVI